MRAMLLLVWGHQKLSDEAEAQAILDAHVETLLERGYDDLRKLAGEIRASYLRGHIKVTSGADSEWADAVAPSGRRYELFTSATWPVDAGGPILVEAEVREADPPHGFLISEFELSPDGSVEVVY
jgi:hypothetical protein